MVVNGLGENGIGFNGIGFNGVGPNSISFNGIGFNGGVAPGAALGELGLHRIYVNGIGFNGIGFNGIGVSQTGVTGAGSSGLYINGVGLQAPYTPGSITNGIGFNGIGFNGFAINTLYINGIGFNGIGFNGIGFNGLYVDGVPLGQVGLDSLVVNGGSATTAILIGDAAGNAVPLTSAQEDIFETIIGNLVGCALPAGDSVTIYSSGGAPQVYPGDQGLAPEWKTGPLDEDAAIVDGEERVRACIDELAVQTGVALNTRQENDLAVVLRYIVECALPPSTGAAQCQDDPGCATVYASDGTARSYLGGLGLAPEWRDGPLSLSGARLVSGCLAARTNGDGKKVQISVRTGVGTPAPTFEKRAFSWREGAFWGNVFGADPTLYTCTGDGPGLTGRRCTEPGGCGFVSLGSCDEVCASVSPQDAHYQMCAGAAEVVTSFLPLSRRRDAGSSHQCAIDTDGVVWCWGSNTFGQLGNGTTTATIVPGAVALPERAVEVAAGDYHTCVRTLSGEVWCWGVNTSGQLGDGTYTQRVTPVKANMPEEAHRLEAGWKHNCAMVADGRVYCWGSDVANLYAPTATPTLAGAPGAAYLGVTAGSNTQCVLKGNGRMDCEGVYQFSSPFSQMVYSWTDAGDVPGYHIDSCLNSMASCILWEDPISEERTLSCCNDSNGYGQLGPGGNSGCQDIPLAAAPVPGTLACMDAAVCVAAEGEGYYCWGYNSDGQLGNDSFVNSEDPVKVQGLPAGTIVESFGGRRYLCASLVTVAGEYEQYCWGDNGWGALGDGTTTDQATAVRMTALDLTPTCGDDVCAEGETSITCAADCGGVCGDGICYSAEESCGSCEADCGVCAPTVLTPTDDAYTKQDKPGDGFGGESKLKISASPGKELRAFLEFDLSGVAATAVNQATLRLYVLKKNGSCDVVQVGDDTWSEQSLTWDTMPTSGPTIGSLALVEKSWATIDVTAFVNSELAGDRRISLACLPTAGEAEIASRDDGTAERRPQLQIIDY